MTKPKISASLIIRNEQDMLPKCLDSIKGVDEIIITDTGSSDDSIEIAEKYGAKVFTDYKWNDDFSEARNESKKHCAGDWLLIIDGDEELKTSIQTIRQLLDQPFMEKKDLVLFDVDTGMENNPQPRLFRNRPDVEWFAAAHNKVTVKLPDGSNKDLAHFPELTFKSTFTIKADLSPNHTVDPDRTLRIMVKEIGKGWEVLGQSQYTRYLYYISREYLNRNDPIRALYHLEDYVNLAAPTNELADAWYIIGTCHLALGKQDKAIDAFLKSVKYVPTLKASWAMLHNMVSPDNRKVFEKAFHAANNKNALFVRQSQEVLLKDKK